MLLPRDKKGVAHIVPISGGKDSTCLALALNEKEPLSYTYIYTPTGNELPEMDKHITNLEKILNAPIIRLTNGTLESQINFNNMLPNVFARWCTRILKLRPAGKFYAEHAPVVCHVGLRADEDIREGTRPGGDSAAIGLDIVQDFPFQRWGWGLEKILSFLKNRNIEIPKRTDCAWCPYQRLGEWYNLWLNHRDIYLAGEELECKYSHTFRSPGRDTWPASLASLRLEFENGRIPVRSLNMMERQNMCRTCSL